MQPGCKGILHKYGVDRELFILAVRTPRQVGRRRSSKIRRRGHGKPAVVGSLNSTGYGTMTGAHARFCGWSDILRKCAGLGGPSSDRIAPVDKSSMNMRIRTRSSPDCLVGRACHGCRVRGGCRRPHGGARCAATGDIGWGGSIHMEIDRPTDSCYQFSMQRQVEHRKIRCRKRQAATATGRRRRK